MAHRLAFVAALLAPAVGAADPDPAHVYVTAAGCLCSAGVSGGRSDGVIGYDLAAAARYGDVWFRGALTVSTMTLELPGHMIEPRIGVEIRTHDNPTAAAFYGVDVGLLDGSGLQEDEPDPATISGGFAMARGGVEIGGVHVRLRVALELLAGYGHAVDPADMFDKRGFLRGGNLSVGIIVR
jgi:hypothetical protein